MAMAVISAPPLSSFSSFSTSPLPLLSSSKGASSLGFRRRAQPASPTCSVQVQARTPITFHIGETSLSIPFSLAAAKGLSSAITGLLTTFKEKEKASRPKRWEAMEYRQTEDGVSFEVFCNPNAHATAFQAKYLITINDDKMKVASEGQLSALKSDVDQYVETQS